MMTQVTNYDELVSAAIMMWMKERMPVADLIEMSLDRGFNVPDGATLVHAAGKTEKEFTWEVKTEILKLANEGILQPFTRISRAQCWEAIQLLRRKVTRSEARIRFFFVTLSSIAPNALEEAMGYYRNVLSRDKEEIDLAVQVYDQIMGVKV